jgi:glycosyltransferase involved in cell wall biosynthesis
MRVAIVSKHVPDPQGRAPDRALFALGEGLVLQGHEVDAWSWSPTPPASTLPDWCRWEPIPAEPRWRVRARALVRPRADIEAASSSVGPCDVAIADEPQSFPAVASAARTVVTLHYSAALDRQARGRWQPADIQDLRAERRVRARSGAVHAYSERVAAVAAGAIAVPIAYPMPPAELAPHDAPVAACVADWTWPPNRAALDLLLGAWPIVRARVPAATLVLAGRGLDAAATPTGVRALGPVLDSGDVLAEAALVVFPCPASSGPKVKVLEAMASGRCVVTTRWGVEGIAPEAAATAYLSDGDVASFAESVIGALGDGAGRAARASTARRAVLASHAPGPAAASRIDAVRRRWPELIG